MGNATTWEFDADDGVYKNHEISGQLLERAAEEFKIVQFTNKVNSFGKQKGESVTLVHWKDPDDPTSTVLDETTRIPIDKLQMGTRNIVVKEWGRGIEYTNLMKELSLFDPKAGAQKMLLRQMRRAMDLGAMDAFKEAKVIFIPTSVSAGTWDTDGTPSTEALANITKKHMGLIRDYMVKDLHVPHYEGGCYIGMFSTKALRGLKEDEAIEAWHQYLRKGELIFNSEIGKCEEIRLTEITNEDALSSSKGSSGVLGEAIVHGDEAVSRIEVDFPHLRADPNYQGDFGRIKAVIWYGIVNFGATWITANDREAKIVRITSG